MAETINGLWLEDSKTDKKIAPKTFTGQVLSNDGTKNLDTLLGEKAGTATATTTADGLMSSADKAKLDGVATGASAVTESTVSGWGFTKNTGTYSKPSTGIPKTDLASGVIPTSLPANGGTATNVSGTVAIANGGTGATTASGARTNLGLGGAATKTVDTSIAAASTSANLPTSAAVASFVEGKGYKTTDNNTTYTFAEGSTNGAFSVTPSGGSATNVKVHGLGSLAYSSATIPTVTDTYSSTSSNAMSGKAVASAISGKAGTDVATTSSNGLMSSSDKAALFAFGICTTSRAVAAKALNITGFTLTTGAKVYVRFNSTITTDPTSGNLTLNVTNTGAKNIVFGNNVVMTASVYAKEFCNNKVAEFVYDGTSWVYTNYDKDTTYTPSSLGFGYGTCETAAATTAKIFTSVSGGTGTLAGTYISILFSKDVCANATLGMSSLLTKAIYYMNKPITDGIIKAGDTATFINDGTRYRVVSIDRMESGTSTVVLTQAQYDALPSSKLTDGKIYVISDADAPITASNIEYGNTNLEDALTASDNLKFRFATDGEGNYGYLKADDSFVPFKSGSEPSEIKKINYTSINSSSYYADTAKSTQYTITEGFKVGIFVVATNSGNGSLSPVEIRLLSTGTATLLTNFIRNPGGSSYHPSMNIKIYALYNVEDNSTFYLDFGGGQRYSEFGELYILAK